MQPGIEQKFPTPSRIVALGLTLSVICAAGAAGLASHLQRQLNRREARLLALYLNDHIEMHRRALQRIAVRRGAAPNSQKAWRIDAGAHLGPRAFQCLWLQAGAAGPARNALGRCGAVETARSRAPPFELEPMERMRGLLPDGLVVERKVPGKPETIVGIIRLKDLLPAASGSGQAHFGARIVAPGRTGGRPTLPVAGGILQLELQPRSLWQHWSGTLPLGLLFGGVFLTTAYALMRRSVESNRDLSAAHEDLASQRVRLGLALEIAHAGIWSWNLKTNAVTWDDGLLRLMGVPREDFRGTFEDFSDRLFPEDLPRMAEHLQRCAQTGAEFRAEFRIRRPDGAVRHLAARGRALRDAGGALTEMVGIDWDITDQVRAARELNETSEVLRVAWTAAGMGVWSHNLETDQVFWDATTYRLYDTDQAGFPNPVDAWYARVSASDSERIGQVIAAAIESGGIFSEDFSITCGDESLRWLTIRGQLVVAPGSADRQVVGVVWDVTDLKQAEAQLKDLNQSLEKRVAERTAELTAANTELEAFTFSVSHDLRSPLRHMVGFLSLFRGSLVAPLPDNSEKHLKVVEEASARMGQLVDDLLAFSRVGRTEMRKATVDMHRVFEETIAALAPDYNGRAIDWQLDALPPAQGDAALLRQAAENLISNAIKYTATKPRAQIEVSAEETGEVITYCVADNGVGFDMEYVGKLFGVFQRLHRQPDFQGTGIGLANVARIVRRHGGQVWAEGKTDVGARFFFTLPVPEVTKPAGLQPAGLTGANA